MAGALEKGAKVICKAAGGYYFAYRIGGSIFEIGYQTGWPTTFKTEFVHRLGDHRGWFVWCALGSHRLEANIYAGVDR